MVRLWTWEAFAHGAEVVSYFRWRQAPFAQEQMHAGLLRPDDAAAPGLDEVTRVAQEIRSMPQIEARRADVALIFDYPSEWAWAVLPQGAGFSYFRLVLDAYRALRKLGLSVDIVPSSASDLGGYRLVLAPGLATLPDALRQALGRTTNLVGPRAGAVTQELTIPQPPGPDLPALDCRVVRVESLPPGATRAAEGGGAVAHWVEMLEGGAEVTLRLEDTSPLMMRAGHTHYLGGYPDEALWSRILSQLAATAGVETQTMPEGVRIRDTATHRFYFNYAPEPKEIDGITLPVAGVHWRSYPG
jgi:beta-galactosidase